MSTDCPFCRPAAEQLFYVGDHVLGLWDAFPVSPGHALLVTKRHVAGWFDASNEERSELVTAIELARAAIEQWDRPDGLNLGVNIGTAAGQTVPHLLPRIPRGGLPRLH